MSKCVVWFEDTTKDPDRVGTRVPSLGLAVELLPLNLNVTGKQFYDETCENLSGILVDSDAANMLREIAEKSGTIAWVRNYSGSTCNSVWEDMKTLDGRQAFISPNNTGFTK